MQIEDPKIKVPAMLIMGEKDYCLKIPGMEEYIRSGMVKHFVPDLEVIFMPEGSHFVHEQSPDEVNGLIVTFLNKHIWQAGTNIGILEKLNMRMNVSSYFVASVWWWDFDLLPEIRFKLNIEYLVDFGFCIDIQLC